MRMNRTSHEGTISELHRVPTSSTLITVARRKSLSSNSQDHGNHAASKIKFPKPDPTVKSSKIYSKACTGDFAPQGRDRYGHRSPASVGSAALEMQTPYKGYCYVSTAAEGTFCTAQRTYLLGPRRTKARQTSCVTFQPQQLETVAATRLRNASALAVPLHIKAQAEANSDFAAC